MRPKLHSLPKLATGPIDRFRTALQPVDANSLNKRHAEDPAPAEPMYIHERGWDFGTLQNAQG